MNSTFKGRPTFCSIDIGSLCWNFRQVKKKVGPEIKVLSVVKANAYGHGEREIAVALESEGTDGLGVATLEEGLGLRKSKISSPILILGGVLPQHLDELYENNLTPVISEEGGLRELEEKARRRKIALPFHLKVDTGMGRIGFLSSDVATWLPMLKNMKALRLEGILSHFADAERYSGDATLRQLDSFRYVLQQLEVEGYHPALTHLANSAAVISMPSSYFTMVRPGIMLYGIYPSSEMAEGISLQSVLSWKTQIIQLKKVPKGFSVSYGGTFVTTRESLLATLPLGYADGYKRLLSNRGSVLVRGQRAPVVGNVTMDLTIVDVTDIRGVLQGDEVVLLGKQGKETISVDEMARWAETISYEILTSIGTRVSRIYEY